MATITVTTLSDRTANDGQTTLREALALANGTAGADEIVFASGLSGTITLIEGALEISDDLALSGDVDGNGSRDITLDAAGSSRVLSITGGTVDLERMTITGGQSDLAGAGIAIGSGADVDLTAMRITGNTTYGAVGAGIYANGASVDLTATTVDRNTAQYSSGGGIAVTGGTLSLSRSTIKLNEAGYNGAGIEARDADVTSLYATIDGNTAGGAYGGGVNMTGGSGLFVSSTISRNSASYGGGLALGGDGSATLINATVALNRAEQGGGIYLGSGNVSLQQSTVAANSISGSEGSGVYVGGGRASLTNSIVFGNGVAGDTNDLYGSRSISGGNIINGMVMDGGAIVGAATFGGTFVDVENGRLMLKDNGGQVETVAIRSGGSAEEAADPARLPADLLDIDKDGDTSEPLPLDAAGQLRLANQLPDLGAFEVVRTTLIGNNLDNILVGQVQAETLVGRAGNDVLTGDGGDDLLNGGSGGDTLDGGSGTDTSTYANQGSRVTADLEGIVRGQGAGRDDVFISIENLVGTDFNDDLRGNADANNLTGGEGNDRLNGRAGDDRIVAGAGSDTLQGDAGSDRLIGGSGTDRFVFASADDSRPGGGLRDVITDFNPNGEILDLARMDADTTAAGNQTFVFIGGTGFTGSAGELRSIFSGATLVQGDLDGDAEADFEIQLNGNLTLDAGDFIL